MSTSRKVALLAATLGALSLVSAECPNACSGHGDCGKYDQCSCYRNWQGNDCSLRTCQFDIAHVDSPKGDLDGSNSISDPSSVVIESSQMYPMGTTEQFPAMKDTADNTLTQTAHFYAECSNKGVCDRKTGTCSCFTGYEGVACQRASCNLNCNGHGVCKTIREISALDSGNAYELWDKDATMGCYCDEGWYGPDCNLRECKKGTDPLYLDSPNTLRTATWVLNIAYPASYSTGLSGNYSIRFFDRQDEDWYTEPITAPSGDDDVDCANILAALRNLPNDVVPSGTDDVTCSSDTSASVTPSSSGSTAAQNLYSVLSAKREMEDLETDDGTSTTAHKVQTFTLSFPGLPGVIKQPEVEFHLDSTFAPTLYAGSAVYGYDVLAYWTHGSTIGEDIDYVADYCKGVTVNIVSTTNTRLMITNGTVAVDTASTFLELQLVDDSYFKKLKTCLGDADVDPDNNQDIQNWDYGTYNSYVSPHLIKLVQVGSVDGGRHAMVAYVEDSEGDYHFVLVNDVYPDATDDSDVEFYVYTTAGYLEAVHFPESRDEILKPKDGDFANHVRAVGFYGDRTIFTESDTSCEYSSVNNTNSDYTYTSYMDPFFVQGDDDPNADLRANQVYPCLSKGDIIYLVQAIDDYTTSNAANNAFWGISYATNVDLNPYVIERVWVERFNGAGLMRYSNYAATTDTNDNQVVETTFENDSTMTNRFRILVDNSVPTTTGSIAEKKGILYHFSPPAISSASYYSHTAECSNRGLCNTDTGLCTCFKGYTNDNCDTQSSLAL